MAAVNTEVVEYWDSPAVLFAGIAALTTAPQGSVFHSGAAIIMANTRR